MSANEYGEQNTAERSRHFAVQTDRQSTPCIYLHQSADSFLCNMSTLSFASASLPPFLSPSLPPSLPPSLSLSLSLSFSLQHTWEKLQVTGGLSLSRPPHSTL